MERVGNVVIGAGVVGLAIARALALAGREVLIVEREAQFGTGISARNSEVIHAGLYYRPGSLKARLCLRGRDLLYRYCRERGVGHRQLGKLVIATTPAEHGRLAALAANARRLGVDNITALTPAAVQDREPELFCTAALFSPASGIVDSHQFMLSLLGDAEHAGAVIAYRSTVLTGQVGASGIVLSIASAGGGCTLLADTVINCAGLDACALAQSIGGVPPVTIPAAAFAKGSYFALTGCSPFQHLIYPVPEAGGLGVHVTLDLAGQAKFGPDVEWVARPDYRVDPGRQGQFEARIRQYWPGLPPGRLHPAYAGVRPKLSGPGSADADFVIAGPATHGVAGLFHLFGIESPGLTAALAIGESMAALVAGRLPEAPAVAI